MTDRFDANRVLDLLLETRKVFHSEADLQFAFAWTANTLYPFLVVRLESHPTPHESLDLALIDTIANGGIAIEFKYKTAFWEGESDGESYALKSHGASDIGGYDIIKDVTRVERFIEGRKGWTGYVITLTNDSSYWNLRTHGRTTNAEAFRVSEGLVLSGIKEWGPNTGGTKKGRESALELRGRYELHWREYSRISDKTVGIFKAQVIQIENKIPTSNH
ncbi:MAG: hypothetical protein WCO85_06605 [Actinomycetes bacterium]